jgi:hypothetical protein
VPLRSPFRLDYPLNDGMLVAPAEAVVAWLDQVRFCFVDTTRPISSRVPSRVLRYLAAGYEFGEKSAEFERIAC